MQDTIQKLLVSGKGLLALDWSTKTITKKFLEVGLTSTPELNRQYRQMLLTSPGIENFISGVILFDETARQNLDGGKPFPQFLVEKGVVPGIKVDLGGEKFNGGEEETTLGLTGLPARLDEYFKLGFRFTKWRSVFKISDIFPTKEFLEENLNRLTKFAQISIEHGFVPVVEPEISMKGNHTTTRCAETTSQVLEIMFEKFKAADIELKQVILKTNMIVPGQDSPIKAEP
jgi:fructose-bisphosphate aldolase class I